MSTPFYSCLFTETKTYTMRKKFIFTFATLIICFSLSAQTWYQIDSTTDRELKTIQFISDEIGFIGGDSILLKTLDGGISWNEIVTDLGGVEWVQYLDVYDLHFFDENHGYVMSGLYGAMLETFDGGITWASVNISLGFCQQASLYFESEDYGFAGGGGCFSGHFIEKFVDGVLTPVVFPVGWSGTDYVTTINFKNPELGFAGTVEGILLRTTDGGGIWDTIPNLATGYAITDIDFAGDLIRISHHNIQEWSSMTSIDDGLTWQVDWEIGSFFYPKLNSLHTTSEGLAYTAGEIDNFDGQEGVIFERTAFFWNSVPVENRINDIESHSGASVFAVGDNGSIYTNQADLASNIGEPQANPIRVYPNPVSVGEELTIENPKTSVFSVRLFDIQGKEIANKNKTTLNQEMSISTEGLERGVYLIKVYEGNVMVPISIRRLVVN